MVSSRWLPQDPGENPGQIQPSLAAYFEVIYHFIPTEARSPVVRHLHAVFMIAGVRCTAGLKFISVPTPRIPFCEHISEPTAEAERIRESNRACIGGTARCCIGAFSAIKRKASMVAIAARSMALMPKLLSTPNSHGNSFVMNLWDLNGHLANDVE